MLNKLFVYLRTPLIYNLIEKEKYSKPMTYCPTLRHNIYDTLKCLIDLLPFLKNKEVKIQYYHYRKKKWEEIELFNNSLSYKKIAIKNLQLVLSDLVRIWKK